MAEPLEICEITDPQVWKLLGDPLRRSILQAFSSEPKTTKQVSQVLGIKSNKLYHHVDLLLEHGLLRLVETRPKRGTTEKYLQAVARRFLVRPVAIGSASDGTSFVEQFVTELGHEVAYGLFQPDGPRTLGVKGEISLTEEGLAEFRERFAALMEDIDKGKEGDRYSVTLLAFPLKGID
jgi:DNA-binding transcriptional ArsR family regulator